MLKFKRFGAISLVTVFSLILSNSLFAEEFDETMNVQDLVDYAETAQENLDNYYMTLNHIDTDAQVEEWMKKFDDTEHVFNIITKSDGNTMYIVDNQVTYTTYEDGSENAYKTQITEDVFRGTDGIYELLKYYDSISDVEFIFEETVADFEVVLISFTPSDDEIPPMDVWIDTEYYLPFKVAVSEETIYELVSFKPNVELEENTFQIDFPENVTVVEEEYPIYFITTPAKSTLVGQDFISTLEMTEDTDPDTISEGESVSDNTYGLVPHDPSVRNLTNARTFTEITLNDNGTIEIKDQEFTGSYHMVDKRLTIQIDGENANAVIVFTEIEDDSREEVAFKGYLEEAHLSSNSDYDLYRYMNKFLLGHIHYFVQ